MVLCAFELKDKLAYSTEYHYLPLRSSLLILTYVVLFRLILQCCTFAGLRFSQDVGVTNVGPGEAITGGEVIRDGRQISFDVIANARKVVDANTHMYV